MIYSSGLVPTSDIMMNEKNVESLWNDLRHCFLTYDKY